MKAVVLVGGEGTRLRPLTYECPKPLLPIAGIPFVERMLRRLADIGCDEIILSACHRSEAFEQFVSDSRWPVRLVVEDEPLGTGGAIAYAARGFGEEFLVLNGDVLTDVDLFSVVDLHRSRHAEASIVLTPVDDPSRFGVVPTDDDGRVERFIEKPAPGTLSGTSATNMINAGTYVCEPAMLERIPPDRPVSVEREVFPQMAAEGVLFGDARRAYWLDFGTLETYLQGNLDCLEGRLHEPLPGERLDVAGGELWVDPSAHIAPNVTVEGCVVVGPKAVVCSGVLIGPNTVVGPRVQIGSGAVVQESVLSEAAVVEEYANVRRVIIGDRGCVGSGRTVQPGSVIAPDEKI